MRNSKTLVELGVSVDFYASRFVQEVLFLKMVFGLYRS